MTKKTTTPETNDFLPCSTIHSALCACMADVEAVGKNRKNQSQGYAYRGIDDMYNSLHPIFAKHRIFVTCDTINLERHQHTNAKGTVMQIVYGTYRVTFHAEDGSSVSVTCAGEAMDSGDKATNKASSAALKYALMQTLLIPTEDAKDSEVDSPTLETRPAAKPAGLVKATDDEVRRCVQAIKEKQSEQPYQALKAARELNKAQNDLLMDTLQEVFFAPVQDDRPALPTQKPSTKTERAPF